LRKWLCSITKLSSNAKEQFSRCKVPGYPDNRFSSLFAWADNVERDFAFVLTRIDEQQFRMINASEPVPARVPLRGSQPTSISAAGSTLNRQ
jgi:hypothetical protein